METRQALLDGAEALTRERGFDGFSYADLSKSAGITKAAVHHHFPRKADLALTMVRRYRARRLDALARIAARNWSGGERLSDFVEVYREAAAGGSRVCLGVALTLGRDRLTAAVIDEIAALHADILRWLDEAFQAAATDGSLATYGPARAEAAALLALCEGAQVLARAGGSLAAFDGALLPFHSRLIREV